MSESEVELALPLSFNHKKATLQEQFVPRQLADDWSELPEEPQNVVTNASDCEGTA